jgi:hypothetical protein
MGMHHQSAAEEQIQCQRVGNNETKTRPPTFKEMMSRNCNPLRPRNIKR